MRKLTKEEFIEKSKKIHGDKYDYSEVNYVDSRTKVTIVCSKHGEFLQQSATHLMGSGCPNCIKTQKLNNHKFIEKSKKVHGNKYDYSLVKYINSKTKVKIICPKHGEFKTNPKNHYCGTKCSQCRNEDLSNRFSSNTKEFIEKAKKVHVDKYDYSNVDYVNSHCKVNIICKEHGEFKQNPSGHICGRGCPKCAKIKTAKKLSLSKNDFIKKSQKIHGNKYDYSLVKYINHGTKVKIICSEHGEFNQTANSHLVGQGCPICRESKGEKKIREYLVKRGILFKQQQKFDKCINKLKLLFDFYLPNQNLLIEYDGEQHFRTIIAFGGVKGFEKTQRNDNIKNDFVISSKYKLLRIPYYEYNNIENILNDNI